MTESEIRKYDPEDVELKALMGDKFRDKSHETHSDPVTADFSDMPDVSGKEICDAGRYLESNPSYFRMLTACAKAVFVFGGMALLVSYWQNADLMDASVAVPTMCAFTGVMGFGIGKVVGKR